jgi:hypothetical protein
LIDLKTGFIVLKKRGNESRKSVTGKISSVESLIPISILKEEKLYKKKI